ncbi:uncharacterized protein EV420DRAFT_1749586 [Desarmillaria tabescens]|uniref:Uncharacterized protein n=1 Tax=Armillaria tabescens TaxID=1929756 RepID=A0AA39N1S7_ARMTA|nr:uncharacterized protein EV420DRAFT_1749586 [Desarmillaria tabescens]KAK0454025.1 hypothetical protein EV420DRAFT_1749586 [Desarmillaria tabescens]
MSHCALVCFLFSYLACVQSLHKPSRHRYGCGHGMFYSIYACISELAKPNLIQVSLATIPAGFDFCSLLVYFDTFIFTLRNAVGVSEQHRASHGQNGKAKKSSPRKPNGTLWEESPATIMHPELPIGVGLLDDSGDVPLSVNFRTSTTCYLELAIVLPQSEQKGEVINLRESKVKPNTKGARNSRTGETSSME